MKEDLEQELVSSCNNFQPTINTRSRKLDRLKAVNAEIDANLQQSVGELLTLVPIGPEKRGSFTARGASLDDKGGAENIESDEEEAGESA